VTGADDPATLPRSNATPSTGQASLLARGIRASIVPSSTPLDAAAVRTTVSSPMATVIELAASAATNAVPHAGYSLTSTSVCGAAGVNDCIVSMPPVCGTDSRFHVMLCALSPCAHSPETSK
jgi:hypothetical protein